MNNPFSEIALDTFEVWLRGHNFRTRKVDYIIHAVKYHEKLVEMLDRHRWAGRTIENRYYCPECGGFRDVGHEQDCAYAALLAEVKP